MKFGGKIFFGNIDLFWTKNQNIELKVWLDSYLEKSDFSKKCQFLRQIRQKVWAFWQKMFFFVFLFVLEHARNFAREF